MAWARLDDAFYTHAKIIDLTPAARWLFVAGLCYCNQNLTDGAISAPAALSIGMIPAPKKAIGELVKAGLWTTQDGGYLVHDYLEYQRSRAQTLADREAAAKRQARRRRRPDGTWEGSGNGESHGVTPPVTNGVSPPVSHADGSPVVTSTPDPDPVDTYSHHQTDPGDELSTGADDDVDKSPRRSKDQRLARARAACELIGQAAHDAALAAGTVRSNPAGHRRACIQSAEKDYLAAAQLAAHQDRDRTPAEIVAIVAEADQIATAMTAPSSAEVDAQGLYETAEARRLERAALEPDRDKDRNVNGAAAARAALRARTAPTTEDPDA